MSFSSETFSALQLVITLFETLNQQAIKYCHWKSNRGLSEAMAGRTDLDLLVDRSDSQRFKEILYQLDFKPFVSHPRRQFPAIEDYLGLDKETGRLVHLHIHYRLVLGEEYVKNYYLPLETSFLSSTQLRLGVKIPVPELEIIVLVLRTLIKYRAQDAVLHTSGQRSSIGLPSSTLNEFKYLLSQTSLDNIGRALDKHVSFIAPNLIFEFLKTIHERSPSNESLNQLQRQVRRELAPYQRYSRLQARLIYYWAMLSQQWPFDRFLQRFFPKQDKRKIPVSGGLMVGFIGADGAGKSTVVRQIAKWLSWRINVRTYYMGTSHPSTITKVVKAASRLTTLGYAGCRRMFGAKSSITQLADRPKRLFEYLRYLAEGWDRYTRYLASRRKAAQGSIIIYDRYPMPSVGIFNRTMDGPRIASVCNGHMRLGARKLAQIEEKMYQKILPPEHLFVLQVSPEVSQVRKPEHKRELIEAKSQALKHIMQDGCNVTYIDADQPLEDVLLQVKAAIWHLL